MSFDENDKDFIEESPPEQAKFDPSSVQNTMTSYVKNFNGLLEKQADFEAKGDYASLISIQQAIKFNGGGHVSHQFLSADPHHHHTRAHCSLGLTDDL